MQLHQENQSLAVDSLKKKSSSVYTAGNNSC